MSTVLGFNQSDLDRLGRKLSGKHPIGISIPTHLRAAVVKVVQHQTRGSLIWLVDEPRKLASLQKLGFLAWPGTDSRLHSQSVSGLSLERARILVQLQEDSLVVISQDIERVLPRDSWQELVVSLQRGQALSHQALIQSLISAGFERGLSSAGTYEARGDTVIIRDVFDQELRIEFFGDTIERLTRDDHTVSGLSISPLITTGTGNLTEYSSGLISAKETMGSLIVFDGSGKDLGLRLTPYFYGLSDRLAAFLEKYQSLGYKITAEGTDPTFCMVIEAARVDASHEEPQAPGWIWPEAKRLHITERDFLVRRRERASILSLEEFKIEDIVVHRDYGLARFRGLTERVIDGITRSYLILDFAGSDRLYLPTEQLERLSRYLGTSDPVLSKLSGGGWQSTLAKIKKASRDVALELLNRYAKRDMEIGERFEPHLQAEQEFAEHFKYPLTESQQKSVAQVLSDMERPKPMDRLIAGDVGYGKTEVAWRAAYRAILNGRQVALIAPTTILVEQHYQTALQRFEKTGVRIEHVSRFLTTSKQREIVKRLTEGKIDLVIGTHRLLSRDVEFANLGLILIDEEQRFGVDDKERLRRLHEQVDVLALSATPIPRTLELALGEIRPMSVIETPPHGRLPVETQIIPNNPDNLKENVRRELSRGGQVYFVTPRISQIPRLEDEIAKILPDVEVGIAHGQLPEQELAEIMGSFAAGKVKILLASTIVENGLDLPNVNTIIIDDPARFGLAELYQLRGRVGRSDRQAYCFLLTDHRPSAEVSRRLDALLGASGSGGGLQVALRDLEIRGGGNILGREQSGHIIEIGLSLYAKLLDEAKQEIESGRVLQFAEAEIDLSLATSLPVQLVPDVEERLRIYRDIESVEDELALEDVAGRLTNHLGAGEILRNIISLKRLKLRSLGTPVAGIREVARPRVQGGYRDYLVLTLQREASTEEVDSLRMATPGWTAKGIELRLPLDLTDLAPIEAALRALEVLAETTEETDELTPQDNSFDTANND
jgi:transcription-repair coupling factor (superfamily II helicase)